MSAYRVMRLGPGRYQIQLRVCLFFWTRSYHNPGRGFFDEHVQAVRTVEGIDERKRVVWP